MTDWDPEQYERFKAERARPFWDLVALLRPRAGMRVVDLGCGTGELTAELHRRLGAAETVGVDSSGAMLERAVAFATPGLRFVHAEIRDFNLSCGFDLVFSNAALHWLEDHPALLSCLSANLRPGGQLAIQVPANHDHAAFITAAELAQEEPFASSLRGYAGHRNVLSPERYAQLLYDLGFVGRLVRLQVYDHVLSSAEEVVEWVKGTTLTGYAARLPEAAFTAFVAEYRSRLLARLGSRRPFLYTFKRIFVWGRRPPLRHPSP